MGGIILELQREALSKDANIESLLRKAYVIAKKLKLKEFEDWIQLEQNGYGSREVPEYRYVQGQIKARNPYYGWVSVVLSSEIEKVISNVPAKEAISGLIDLYESDNEFLDFNMNSDCNHTSIVFTRYIILKWLRRKQNDQKTYGELFFMLCEDIQDMDLEQALQSLMALFVEQLNKFSADITDFIKNQVDKWMASQPLFIQALLKNIRWES